MSKPPEKLRPYIFHGVRLHPESGDENSGDCPFCGKEDKFYVNSITGKWKCWKCNHVVENTNKPGGNVWGFITEFHKLCMKTTTAEDYKELAKDRLLCDFQPLIEWQVVKSVLNGNWLVPGTNIKGDITSLYRRCKEKDGHWVLKPTPTLGHRLFGVNLFDNSKPIVYLCEGPWDALVLWEVLGRVKNVESRLKVTASRESSLLAQANVVAVPGCETMFDHWLPIFQKKVVNIMFDSDHPRKNSRTNQVLEGAGIRAVKRLSKMLSSSKHAPQEINYLRWGEEGYDPKRKSGYDVRDFIAKG